jgi:hypothetical protein
VTPNDPRNALSTLGGKALAQVFGVLAKVRRTKPLHPRGSVVPIRLVRTGLNPGFGVPWLDEPGVDTGVARFSRSIGLPSELPDILGLALRLEGADGPHDLLLSTTGRRPVLRSMLIPRIAPLTTYGSLFPYETPRGSVVFGGWPAPATAQAPAVLALQVASPVGVWREFGRLELAALPEHASDDLLDLDPVVHPLPGLRISPRFVALREPAYASARAHRPDSERETPVR